MDGYILNTYKQYTGPGEIALSTIFYVSIPISASICENLIQKNELYYLIHLIIPILIFK